MPIIKEIVVEKTGHRPIFVDFQNGKIKSGQEKNLEIGVYENRDKTIVGINNDQMTYAGKIDNENELCNNFILIHNKNANKVRLIQLDSCTVFPLIEKKSNFIEKSPNVSDNPVLELNKQFGSKKAKRHTEQKERLKMNIDTVKEELTNTVSDIVLDETADFSYTESNEVESAYRPKINRDASRIEQVYLIEDLVPSHVLDTLSTEAENIINSDNTESYSFTKFTAESIAKILTSSGSDEDKIQKIKIFMYINYLTKFMNTPMKQVTKRYKVCDISEEVNSHILNNFSLNTKSGRTRPLTMKDKALCFILVLAALALNYEVNINMLHEDMKIAVKKIMAVSKVLAFSSSKSKHISLKLPLPSPVMEMYNQKRKH